MRETSRIVAEWVSGVRDPAGRGGFGGVGVPAARTVVVESDEWIPALVAAGLIEAGAALIHRGTDSGQSAAGWQRTYVGTFTRAGADVTFADGYRLRQVRYGEAEFATLDAPTALVITDGHDFSAFLRDADEAVAGGRFADHATHPFAVIANLAALGGAMDAAGPDHRVFVTADGALSTSPFGRTLGWADDPERMSDRWGAAQGSDGSDAVGLDQAVPGADRTEALAERPWLGRYLEVVAVLRSIRDAQLQPGRVSGFGGRLAVDESGVAGTDPVGEPVLVQVGTAVRAVDPSTGRWHEIEQPDRTAAAGSGSVPGGVR